MSGRDPSTGNRQSTSAPQPVLRSLFGDRLRGTQPQSSGGHFAVPRPVNLGAGRDVWHHRSASKPTQQQQQEQLQHTQQQDKSKSPQPLRAALPRTSAWATTPTAPPPATAPKGEGKETSTTFSVGVEAGPVVPPAPTLPTGTGKKKPISSWADDDGGEIDWDLEALPELDLLPPLLPPVHDKEKTAGSLPYQRQDQGPAREPDSRAAPAWTQKNEPDGGVRRTQTRPPPAPRHNWSNKAHGRSAEGSPHLSSRSPSLGAAVPVLRMEPSVAPLDRPPDSEMGEAIDYTKGPQNRLGSVRGSAAAPPQSQHKQTPVLQRRNVPPEKGAPSAEGEEKSGGDSVAAGRGAKSKDRRNRKKGKGKGKDAARGKDVAQGQDRSESKKPVLIRSAVVGPSVQAGAVPSSSYSVPHNSRTALPDESSSQSKGHSVTSKTARGRSSPADPALHSNPQTPDPAAASSQERDGGRRQGGKRGRVRGRGGRKHRGRGRGDSGAGISQSRSSGPS